jgi:diaminopimelate decarboxylase
MFIQVQGVRTILDIALEVEQVHGSERIRYVDIGGGLSVNYLEDEVSPTFDQYASALQRECPELFATQVATVCNAGACMQPPMRRWLCITEFGKSLIAKAGVVIAKVEDVIVHSDYNTISTETNSSNSSLSTVTAVTPTVTAVTHAGADLFMRPCYVPDKFALRVELLDKDFNVLQLQSPTNDFVTTTAATTITTAATTTTTSTPTGCNSCTISDSTTTSPSATADSSSNSSISAYARPLASVAMAGPLCFSGDIVSAFRPRPMPMPGIRINVYVCNTVIYPYI